MVRNYMFYLWDLSDLPSPKATDKIVSKYMCAKIPTSDSNYSEIKFTSNMFLIGLKLKVNRVNQSKTKVTFFHWTISYEHLSEMF